MNSATIDQDEVDWDAYVATLRLGLQQRQRDGRQRVDDAIAKVERELGPLLTSIAVGQARERQGIPADVTNILVQQERATMLQARLTTLRAIVRKVRYSMRDDDDGPTPETARRGAGNSIQDLPEGLRDSANDLLSGFLVRSPSAMQAKAVVLEQEIRGANEYGKAAEILEHQYVGWLGEMRRLHMPPWPVDDVICRGRDYLESARLRRSDVAVVRLMVQTGLLIYHGLYPPVDSRRRIGV